MNDRNNSWDAFWQDAGKGALALLIPVVIFGVLVFGLKVLLIVLGLVVLWFFIKEH